MKNLLFFVTGGAGYVVLELLWRGRSHISMFLAGGVCFLLLGKMRRLPFVLRGVAGAGTITLVELLTGLLFNRHYQVWDYRNLPVNLWGQICLLFTVLWIPVSLLGMSLYTRLERKIP